MQHIAADLANIYEKIDRRLPLSHAEIGLPRGKSCRWATSFSRRKRMRRSSHRELIACTFSVILAMVRSFNGGISPFGGSIMNNNGIGRSSKWRGICVSY